MWISKRKYERIMERLDMLEKGVRVPCNGSLWTQWNIGTLVYLILEHLGLQYERTHPTEKLVKKGGPDG